MIKITNRSDGIVGYDLPELSIKRSYMPNETKEIDEKELTALYQSDGGQTLILNYLWIQDEDWVEKFFPDAPIEYSWSLEDIYNCVVTDTVELFSETIDYAPEGVVDLIKKLSWQLPLTDLNKVNVLRQKLRFDPEAAGKIMADEEPRPQLTGERKRKRKED